MASVFKEKKAVTIEAVEPVVAKVEKKAENIISAKSKLKLVGVTDKEVLKVNKAYVELNKKLVEEGNKLLVSSYKKDNTVTGVLLSTADGIGSKLKELKNDKTSVLMTMDDKGKISTMLKEDIQSRRITENVIVDLTSDGIVM